MEWSILPRHSAYGKQTPFKVDLIDERRRVTGPPLQPAHLYQPIYKLLGSVDCLMRRAISSSWAAERSP